MAAAGTITQQGHQFNRSYLLTVAKSGATVLNTSTLDLSELRFRFKVRSADIQTPNNMVCRIYNLSEETANALIAEYDQINLQAGYTNAAVGVVFSGQIKRFKKGHENNTDTFLEISAADTDRGYNFGFVNTTHQAGSTYADVVKDCADKMGCTVDPASAELVSRGGVLPRGRVSYGLARIELQRVADSFGARWYINQGVLYLTPVTAYLPGQAVILTPQTGLIGFPEATEDGVEAQCFLNPLIKIGSTIQIASQFITATTQISQSLIFDNVNSANYFASISKNDLYKVLVCDHTGDTRGQDWYTDIVCLAADASTQTVQAFP